MSYKLYFGVDVSKLWLDIAYYDGVDVDWKHGHIRVDNDEKGFAQLGRWLDRLGVGKGTCIFCMEKIMGSLQIMGSVLLIIFHG